MASRGILEGEAVNLSERGIYFRSRENVSIGAPLEIYFRLPRELTGRSAEEVRCSARVVHVEQAESNGGLTGVGATVERFEPISMIRNWHN
ncbi:MAG TPA: PilZ domain-containing protein [Candidatus Binatia bacterium]|nr:PilZ domain-containing protein [Candidatus Binatia bacterium]